MRGTLLHRCRIGPGGLCIATTDHQPPGAFGPHPASPAPRANPQEKQVIPMFGTFLLGTVLMTSLVMVVLLVAPRPNQDIRADRLPVIGALLMLLLAFLAIVGGFAVLG